jgi:small subunit ribosomal protein S1
MFTSSSIFGWLQSAIGSPNERSNANQNIEAEPMVTTTQDRKLRKMTTNYRIGQELLGRVTGIAPYGLFVTLPNKESGLVINSEIYWPKEERVHGVGDSVSVLVIGFEAGKGLSLSIKRALPRTSFFEFSRQHLPGDRVKGQVTSIVDFGAFVRIAPGLDGLAHVNDLGQDETLDDYRVGDEITVRIVRMEQETMRIALSTDLMPHVGCRGI